MCSSLKKGKQDGSANLDLQYVIPDSLFSYFPNEKDDIRLKFYSQNAELLDAPLYLENFSVAFIARGFSFDKGTFKELKQEYEKNSQWQINVIDSNYLSIGSEEFLLGKYDSAFIERIYADYSGQFLLPCFGELLKNSPNLVDMSTNCQLPNDYILYVIKSGATNVLGKEYSFDWSLLPDRLKHGYTSGVAINDINPLIIYWVIAW